MTSARLTGLPVVKNRRTSGPPASTRTIPTSPLPGIIDDAMEVKDCIAQSLRAAFQAVSFDPELAWSSRAAHPHDINRNLPHRQSRASILVKSKDEPSLLNTHDSDVMNFIPGDPIGRDTSIENTATPNGDDYTHSKQLDPHNNHVYTKERHSRHCYKFAYATHNQTFLFEQHGADVNNASRHNEEYCRNSKYQSLLFLRDSKINLIWVGHHRPPLSDDDVTTPQISRHKNCGAKATLSWGADLHRAQPRNITPISAGFCHTTWQRYASPFSSPLRPHGDPIPHPPQEMIVAETLSAARKRMNDRQDVRLCMGAANRRTIIAHETDEPRLPLALVGSRRTDVARARACDRRGDVTPPSGGAHASLDKEAHRGD
ncbi:hypothetical protein Mnod_3816 [Methylobacterium nodulans ORS 2060]|uniref:Uncharacterized protein n=1 Tax=Methylobacterium nodulans (strain LMG 21967 / CNCM I-2342 / ORS 2060) TaxID=460265 RepID=B8IRH6_METNO|nr:hypothetical protein Mnod_3816 [Methylobacterium nodulans ORS 2060]